MCSPRYPIFGFRWRFPFGPRACSAISISDSHFATSFAIRWSLPQERYRTRIDLHPSITSELFSGRHRGIRAMFPGSFRNTIPVHQLCVRCPREGINNRVTGKSARGTKPNPNPSGRLDYFTWPSSKGPLSGKKDDQVLSFDSSTLHKSGHYSSGRVTKWDNWARNY